MTSPGIDLAMQGHAFTRSLAVQSTTTTRATTGGRSCRTIPYEAAEAPGREGVEVVGGVKVRERQGSELCLRRGPDDSRMELPTGSGRGWEWLRNAIPSTADPGKPSRPGPG